jgi:hypothetical protein
MMSYMFEGDIGDKGLSLDTQRKIGLTPQISQVSTQNHLD